MCIVLSTVDVAKKHWRVLAVIAVLAGSVAAGFSALLQITRPGLAKNEVDVARVREHSRTAWPECVALQQQIGVLKSEIGQGGGGASLQGDLRGKISRRNDLGC